MIGNWQKLNLRSISIDLASCRKKRVLFRADGDSIHGLGHVYRCLAIAERISSEFECYFAIRYPSDQLISQIIEYSSILLLDPQLNHANEIEEELLSIIEDYRIEIITLDGYDFNTEYQKKIKELSNCFLISIDDFQPFHYVSDIVINHAGGVNSDMFSKENYTKLLLGYDYLLLRKNFINIQQKAIKKHGVESILICFGGADSENFTQKISDFIKDLDFINKIYIVIGSSYCKKSMLLSSLKAYSHIEIFENLTGNELSEIMLNTDLAIVPSSTISLEAFALNMILITGMTDINQISIFNGFNNQRRITTVDFGNLTQGNLLKILSNINTDRYTREHYNCRSTEDSILKIYQSIK